MGKGGGGAPQPTSQTVNQTNLPEYARPYFEDLLQRGQAASQVQYQPYQGERVAGFTPLQQQGFEGVQNLGVSPLLQPAAGMTGAAGLGGLFAGQNYAQQATSPGSMQAYMSPYMQNVVDFQKSQAIADYGRQLPGMQAAATNAGAFGGSRQAIVASEAQRNLQNQLAGIQATGTQSAFDQARQAQQFGSQLGLQGLGLAGQMGQQFGQLGQTAFGQQAAAAQAQQQTGAAQQAQQQDILNKRYEDFMQQTTYPQSQLQFYSSLLRGVPVAPQQTMYQYQAAPSMASQIGGLGLGALGLSQAFKAKDGGEVPGYAEGGITGGKNDTVTRVKEMVDGLQSSPNPDVDILRYKTATPFERLAALEQVKRLRNASASAQALQGGQPQGTVLDDEMAKFNSGIARDVPEEIFAAASGGIVAFEEGGPTSSPMGRFFGGIGDFISGGPEAAKERERQNALLAQQRDVARRLTELGGMVGLAQQTPAQRQEYEDLLRQRDALAASLRSGSAGLPAALPAPAAQDQTAQNQRELNRLPPPAAKPDLSQQVPTARPAAPAAPALQAAPEKTEEGAGMIPLQDVAKKEQEYRDYMGKKYSSELQDRLAELKEQAQEAVKEGDKARGMALFVGAMKMMSEAAPGGRGLTGFLRDFGNGMGLTGKEIMVINKDLRKANDALKKAEREERKADRLEQMGMDDKAYQVRQNAEKFNLDAQKANQSFSANIQQTKAFKDVNMARIASEAATRREMAAGRQDARADAERQKDRLAVMARQKDLEKTLEGYNTRLQELALLQAQGVTETKFGGKTVKVADLARNVAAARDSARKQIEADWGMTGGGQYTPEQQALLAKYGVQ